MPVTATPWVSPVLLLLVLGISLRSEAGCESPALMSPLHFRLLQRPTGHVHLNVPLGP